MISKLIVRWLGILSVSALSILLVTDGVLAAPYVVVDLGGLPGATATYAEGVNNHGVVVGSSNQGGGYNRIAFRWDGRSGMQNLGVLPGVHDSCAYAVNDLGYIVGLSGMAFIWDAINRMQEIVLQGDEAGAKDINASGQVIGYTFTSATGTLPFIWDSVNGVREIDLPQDISGAHPFGINAYGEVTGLASGASGGAFFWDDAGGMVIIDLPTGASGGVGYDINDAGVVAGLYMKPGLHGGFIERGFVWDGVLFRDLGSLDGNPYDGPYWAFAINNRGQVVGRGTYGHGWIWNETDGMRNLNDLIPGDSVFTIGRAADINDHGQIVASGNVGTYTHAVLLTPNTDNDGDEDIDGSDLYNLVMECDGVCSGNCTSDYNEDGSIDHFDVMLFAMAYGR
jgi:probable HAF family extracellular repeat protein